MHQARSLLATITDPWESLTQTLRDADPSTFGDPRTPGTPAFHLHHTAAIFRLHARTLMEAIGPDRAKTDSAYAIPPYEAPVPLTGDWSPRATLTELTAHAEIFAAWLEALPEGTIEQTTLTHSDRDQPASEFLDMMTRHIVWHAAAAYYRAKPL